MKRQKWHSVETVMGTFHVATDGQAITRTTLPGTGCPGTPDPSPRPHPLLEQAAHELQAWAEGGRRAFDLPLAPAGTPFQRQVWHALQQIPYGETRSYGRLAAAIGKPGAARAVGQANNKNPLAPFIPCHRVVQADGSLGGYGGGSALKQAMLDMERTISVIPGVSR